MKHVMRVLQAVESGGETSDQIAAMTGISKGAVSSYLHELTEDGLIRRVREGCRRVGDRGPFMHIYAPREVV